MSKRLLGVALLGLVLLVAYTLIAYGRAAEKIASDKGAVGRASVGIVFGASVKPDKKPSVVLRDRIITGVELLKDGRVDKLLLSGDSRESNYDEVSAMKKLAVDLGAEPERLLLDGGGHRTYDTCQRAKEVFGETDVILVTQRFHLPRAIYVCSKLGLKPLGLAADRSNYEDVWRFELREWAAWLVAFVDVL